MNEVEDVRRNHQLYWAVMGAFALVLFTSMIYLNTTSRGIFPRWLNNVMAVMAFGVGSVAIAAASWRDNGDPRPRIISTLSILLMIVMAGVAVLNSSSYLSTFAGILASLTIAVAAASTNFFVAPNEEE